MLYQEYTRFNDGAIVLTNHVDLTRYSSKGDADVRSVVFESTATLAEVFGDKHKWVMYDHRTANVDLIDIRMFDDNSIIPFVLTDLIGTTNGIIHKKYRRDTPVFQVMQEFLVKSLILGHKS